jgi:pimeloyl-[acyl-carrier protein] methyl ester esterase
MLTFILISGWASGADALFPLRDKLSQTASVHTLSLHDLPGFVETVRDDENLSAYASGLLSYVQSLKGRCVVAGWSTGGIVALEAAAHNQDQIAGIVIMNGTARFCTDKAYEFGRPEVILRAMSQGLSKAVPAVLTGFFADVFSPFVPDSHEISRSVEAASRIDAYELKAGLQYLREVDLRTRLKNIAVPTLIIHGREDSIVPLGAGQYLSDNITRSECVVCDHVGHDLPLRYPAKVEREIRGFSERYFNEEDNV